MADRSGGGDDRDAVLGVKFWVEEPREVVLDALKAGVGGDSGDGPLAGDHAGLFGHVLRVGVDVVDPQSVGGHHLVVAAHGGREPVRLLRG